MKSSYTQLHSTWGSESSVLKRVISIFYLVPILWLLGGERLLLPLIVILLFASSLRVVDFKAKHNLLFLLFLFGYLLSLVQVSSPLRYLTYFWDFSIYLSFFVLFLVVSKNVKTIDGAQLLSIHLIISLSILNLIALSYFLLKDFQWQSPLGLLLPDSVLSTATGQNILRRSVGRELYFWGIQTRLSSIFVSSMQYAAVCLLLMPLFYYALCSARKWWKVLFFCLFCINCGSLYFSQGRSAILLVAVFLALVPGYSWLLRVKKFGRSFSYFSILLCFIYVLTSVLVYWEYFSELFSEVFINRRSNSYSERMEVYVGTIEGIINSPLFGHGTQTTIEGLKVPLGSHNWYLGVLYKHGVFGFFPFLFFIVSIYWRSIKNTTIFRSASSANLFTNMLAASLLMHFLLCITAEPVVDAVHIAYLGVVFGLAISIGRWSISGITPSGSRVI